MERGDLTDAQWVRLELGGCASRVHLTSVFNVKTRSPYGVLVSPSGEVLPPVDLLSPTCAGPARRLRSTSPKPRHRPAARAMASDNSPDVIYLCRLRFSNPSPITGAPLMNPPSKAMGVDMRGPRTVAW